MMTVNDVINERAQRESISFDAAAERYFFDAVKLVKKKNGCVITRPSKRINSARKLKCGVCKHRNLKK